MRSIATILVSLLLASAAAFAQEAAPAQDATLEQFLAQRGWVAIQLRENAFSQLETELVLEGQHAVRAQVSTSFSKTIFDQATIRGFGLAIEPTSIEISGSGGKQRLGSVQLDRVAFGETVVETVTIFTADLAKLVSRSKDSEPIQAVIGSDFLTRYQAVLEIPTSKLYLRLR